MSNDNTCALQITFAQIWCGWGCISWKQCTDRDGLCTDGVGMKCAVRYPRKTLLKRWNTDNHLPIS